MSYLGPKEAQSLLNAMCSSGEVAAISLEREANKPSGIGLPVGAVKATNVLQFLSVATQSLGNVGLRDQLAASTSHTSVANLGQRGQSVTPGMG